MQYGYEKNDIKAILSGENPLDWPKLAAEMTKFKKKEYGTSENYKFHLPW